MWLNCALWCQVSNFETDFRRSPEKYFWKSDHPVGGLWSGLCRKVVIIHRWSTIFRLLITAGYKINMSPWKHYTFCWNNLIPCLGWKGYNPSNSFKIVTISYTSFHMISKKLTKGVHEMITWWVGIKESGRPKPSLLDSGCPRTDSCRLALYTQQKEQVQTWSWCKIWISFWSRPRFHACYLHLYVLGAVAWSEASSLGMQAAPSSILPSGTFFRGDLVMKTFLRPFSLFCWFKKSSCQLLAKECALNTGKLPRRLAQEQCG